MPIEAPEPPPPLHVIPCSFFACGRSGSPFGVQSVHSQRSAGSPWRLRGFPCCPLFPSIGAVSSKHRCHLHIFERVPSEMLGEGLEPKKQKLYGVVRAPKRRISPAVGAPRDYRPRSPRPTTTEADIVRGSSERFELLGLTQDRRLGVRSLFPDETGQPHRAATIMR